MKSLKKFAVASMTCAALLGFAATSHAAYQLNDEVKDATPALLMASQVGVKTNVNPALANLPDKDAIVGSGFVEGGAEADNHQSFFAIHL